MILGLRAGAVLLFAAPWAWAAEADFSGSWILDPGASEMRPMPAPASANLKIRHNGIRVQCETDGQSWGFTTDRSETRHSYAGARANTAAKWEGAALLVNTVVSGASNYTVMDRWRLSGDGARLTIRRQVVSRTGEVESTLIYRREGAEAIPASSPSAPAPSQPVLDSYTVSSGTKIPLALVNSISTKHSAVGDRVYLQTVFPVVVDGRVVIPPGSYVIATVTRVKRPGRAKGRGELFLRFDNLTLPNGVARDFRARIDASDAEASVDKREGAIRGDSNKGADARTIGETTAAGASIGGIAGAATHHPGVGLGAGAAAGAAAGLASVLLSRGPDIVLAKGTTVEMVLDRALKFSAKELP